MMIIIIDYRGSTFAGRAVFMPVRPPILAVVEHHIPIAVRSRDTNFMAPMKRRHRLNGRRHKSWYHGQINQQQHPAGKAAPEGYCWARAH